MALYDIVVKMYDVSYRAVETRTTDSDFLYKDGKQDQDFFFFYSISQKYEILLFSC